MASCFCCVVALLQLCCVAAYCSGCSARQTDFGAAAGENFDLRLGTTDLLVHVFRCVALQPTAVAAGPSKLIQALLQVCDAVCIQQYTNVSLCTRHHLLLLLLSLLFPLLCPGNS